MVSPWIAPVIMFSILLIATLIFRERDKKRNSGKKLANTQK